MRSCRLVIPEITFGIELDGLPGILKSKFRFLVAVVMSTQVDIRCGELRFLALRYVNGVLVGLKSVRIISERFLCETQSIKRLSIVLIKLNGCRELSLRRWKHISSGIDFPEAVMDFCGIWFQTHGLLQLCLRVIELANQDQVFTQHFVCFRVVHIQFKR